MLGARSGEPAPLCPPVLDAQDELVEAVHVLEAGLVRDREDDEEAVPRAHVLLPHGTELLLPGRVQNWGGMGQSGLSPVPWAPHSLQTPRCCCPLSGSIQTVPTRATQAPGLGCGVQAGPQTPQCEALIYLLMAPQIPTHGAPRAVVLGLQKGL